MFFKKRKQDFKAIMDVNKEILSDSVYGEQTKAMINKLNFTMSEIMQVGWTGIINKYHPDNNVGNPHAHEIWQWYATVCKRMQDQLKINVEDNSNVSN